MARSSKRAGVLQSAAAAGSSPKRATKATQTGHLVLEESPATSRLFVFLIGNYLQRIDHHRRSVYFGDLDLARIAEIIGIAGVEPGMRDDAFRREHRSFASVVGVAAQRGVNATSIANATGIPRETVRRKLARLVKLGMVVEKGRTYYVLNPGALQDPGRQAAFARGVQETVVRMNEALQHGVVRWRERPAGSASRRK